MKNFFLFSLLCTMQLGWSQSIWTETDRQYLLDNLNRTTNALEKAVSNLTAAQWHFKPDPDSWSIAQVIEHLGIYEKKYFNEARMISLQPAEPELHQTTSPDRYYLNWMAEGQAHRAPTADIPLGFMHGSDNWTYFLAGRTLNRQFIASTEVDLRAQYTYRQNEKRWNLHQLYIILFAHCDRHLRQIERIRQEAGFPEATPTNENDEVTAIMTTIEAETDCFFQRNYECWKQHWVTEDHAFQAWNNADGSFDARTGWSAVDREIGDYIEQNPVTSGDSRRRVVRKNLSVKFYSDGVAYLLWDQYNENSEGNTFIHSKESRIMEKHNGAWRIAQVASFWDYSRALLTSDLK